MNDIAQNNPLAAAGADIFDLYPTTINTKIGALRLVSATGDHAPESPFTVLETVWGLPCDGLVYLDDTERRGRHLVAVFHGEAEDGGPKENGAIAICHDWKWKWYAGGGSDVTAAIRFCIQGGPYESAPPAGTLVGDLARKGAEVAA